MLTITIINGPNLNLLGTREKDIYGNRSFEEYFEELRQRYNGLVALQYNQSNIEGEIVNLIQACENDVDYIIINAAGYSHTSVAIADALAAVSTPAIEVHISNIYAREEFRKTSLTAANCIGVITGLGLDGYRLAIEHCLASETP